MIDDCTTTHKYSTNYTGTGTGYIGNTISLARQVDVVSTVNGKGTIVAPQFIICAGRRPLPTLVFVSGSSSSIILDAELIVDDCAVIAAIDDKLQYDSKLENVARTTFGPTAAVTAEMHRLFDCGVHTAVLPAAVSFATLARTNGSAAQLSSKRKAQRTLPPILLQCFIAVAAILEAEAEQRRKWRNDVRQ